MKDRIHRAKYYAQRRQKKKKSNIIYGTSDAKPLYILDDEFIDSAEFHD